MRKSRNSATARSKSSSSASDLMKFSTSSALSTPKLDENRPKTRAQSRISAVSKWSDQNSSDTEVETDVEIQIEREKEPEKIISEIFIPQAKEFSQKSRISKTEISALSNWSDKKSDEEEKIKEENERKVSSLSKWSENHSKKSEIGAQVSALSKWSDNGSAGDQKSGSKVHQLSAISKWSDDKSEPEEEIKEENDPKIVISSVSKWSDNRSEKSRFSKADISALSKWSDNDSAKEEKELSKKSLKSANNRKTQLSSLSKWSDNQSESDKEENSEIKEENPPKVETADWRSKINTADFFSTFKTMRDERDIIAKPVATSSLSKWSDNESEKGGESRAVSNLSAWTDKKSDRNERSNISKWTDNESDGEKTPQNKGIMSFFIF